MAQEAVTISNLAGETKQGEADEVVRYSDAFRITTAVLYGVGCLFGAAACVFVPVAHFFGVPGLIFLAFYLGTRTLKRRVVIHDAKGECPVCGEQIDLPGGSIDDPAWQRCPACKAQLAIDPGTPAGTPNL